VKVTDEINECTATSAKVKVKVPCKVIEENLNRDDYNLSVYPNPLSAATTISFSLPQSGNVWVKIYDLQGRLICTLASESMIEGEHMIIWDARDENRNEVSAGIYVLKLQTAGKIETVLLSVAK
jgi:flagellar hook assembly protein FlgD